MAKLQRKTAKVFAGEANPAVGGLAQFGSLAAGNPNYSTDPDVIQALNAYNKGWSAAVVGTKSPALEDRNALDYLLSYQQAYIMQRGIPEYLDTETYYQGSFVSKADGALYVSKSDNNTGHDPALDTAETYWMKFPTPAELAGSYVAKAGDTMTGALTVQANITSTGDVSAANVTASTKMTTVTPATNSNDTTVPTTAWVRTYLGSVNMLGRMNYNAAVSLHLTGGQTYTAPSKGYIYLCRANSTSSNYSIKINENTILTITSADESAFPYEFYPVSQGDVLKNAGSSTGTWIQGFFAPQI